MALGIRAEHWPLSRPFRISRGVKTVADVVVVELLASDRGLAGRGESVPYARYGETVASVTGQLEPLRASLADGSISRDTLHRYLPAGAARNALDCALWDLEAQLLRRCTTDMLGEPPIAPMTNAVTIGLDEPAAMAEAARAASSAALIKIKVDARDPARQIQAVRTACPRSELIVDPNESWTAALLREIQPVLIEYRVALLEQPLPAGDELHLDGFTSAVPICADESCHTAADLPRLLGHYQYVNIKLDKTGGLTSALELLHEARALGFGIMTGCMICTSLSIAPALHIARHARFVDLDGPFWLARDRAGGVTYSGPQVLPPQRGFWGEPHDPARWVNEAVC
jgi:L-alanine-DL-glutamate epimerase-like enolase superfamily enzyme